MSTTPCHPPAATHTPSHPCRPDKPRHPQSPASRRTRPSQPSPSKPLPASPATSSSPLHPPMHFLSPAAIHSYLAERTPRLDQPLHFPHLPHPPARSYCNANSP